MPARLTGSGGLSEWARSQHDDAVCACTTTRAPNAAPYQHYRLHWRRTGPRHNPAWRIKMARKLASGRHCPRPHPPSQPAVLASLGPLQIRPRSSEQEKGLGSCLQPAVPSRGKRGAPRPISASTRRTSPKPPTRVHARATRPPSPLLPGSSVTLVALACKGPLNARLATGVALSFYLSSVTFAAISGWWSG